MRALLDTNVLSELQQPNGQPRVQAYVAALASESVFVSVISIGELTKGIALLSPGRRKQEIALWLLSLESEYADRILPVELDTTRLWGELTARAQQQGIQIPMSDGLIAATAIRHGLHVVTRNTRDFEPTGVPLINPWEF